MDSVGAQDEQVAGFERQLQMVDLDMRPGPERPRQMRLRRRHSHAVLLGQHLERPTRDTGDPSVPDMEKVRRPPFQHQRVQRAHVAAVAILRALAGARLGMQPRIDRGNHPAGRGLYRPSVRRAVVVVEEIAHGNAAGGRAHPARTDTVRQRHRDALQAQRRLLWHHGAVEILVRLSPASLRALAKGDDEVFAYDITRRRLAPVRTCVE